MTTEPAAPAGRGHADSERQRGCGAGGPARSREVQLGSHITPYKKLAADGPEAENVKGSASGAAGAGPRGGKEPSSPRDTGPPAARQASGEIPVNTGAATPSPPRCRVCKDPGRGDPSLCRASITLESQGPGTPPGTLSHAEGQARGSSAPRLITGPRWLGQPGPVPGSPRQGPAARPQVNMHHAPPLPMNRVTLGLRRDTDKDTCAQAAGGPPPTPPPNPQLQK